MSENPRPARRRRALLAALAGIGLLGAPLAALPAVATPADPGGTGGAGVVGEPMEQLTQFQDDRYFVILKDHPIATYEGGKEGIPATAVTDGEFNPDSAAAQEYAHYLTEQQEAVAASQSVKVDRHFTTALNAFTAELSAQDATVLSKDPRVLAVSEDVEQAPDYSSTEFLGLPGPGGTWDTTYGGAENAGRGVVVGVIDTGYYPDQEMLAGDPVEPLSGQPQVGVPYRTSDGRIAMLKADGTTFRGDCEPGEDFDGDECNSKVLSARYYSEDFERFVPVEERNPDERLSPIDIGSHGTHTATTAAGNRGVEQIMNDGASYGEGSGVAPEAKVAVYKTCFEDTDPNTGGCYISASVAAIEDAIIDNVDVLNYSISGNNTTVADPVSMAFKSAAEAGIFVAASAGNAGPAANTVNHSAPWLTSVAATTFSNELMGTVEFEDGTKVRGVSAMVEGAGPAEIVHSSEVGRAGAPPGDVRRCILGSLDPELVQGKIVVCDRGENPRVDKSQEVADAGGVGMVLVNIGGGSEDADPHAVPTVHTSDESITAKVIGSDLTATLVPGDTTGLPEPPVPQIAGFSSRGPSNAVNSELLKPDVAAPGVNVIAGVSALDPMYNGDSFGLMSGTSMAAPNLAGMAALLSGEHPDWSPMAMKSAMATTADQVYTAEGTENLDNFATGAGSADPRAMAAPGLVYDSDARQWDAMLLGQLPAREVNAASFAVSDLLGSATVTRTVTATQAGTWAASGHVPGYDVSVSPSTLSLAAGESAEFSVTFTRTDAAADTWSHGSLSWQRPGGTDVESPVSLRSVDVKAEPSVVGEGSTGSVDVELQPGITGELEPSVEGLGLAETEDFTKAPGGGPVVGDDNSNHLVSTNVPEGATSVTWSLDAADDDADWDLFVVTPSGGQVQSATPNASESVTLTDPPAGEYWVVSHLYSSSDGDETSASLETVLMSGDADNLAISPDPLTVTNGEATTATLSWDGLTQGTWKGMVTWGVGARTHVTVNVDELPDFADNPPGSQYYTSVRWMQYERITQGYASDNTYRKYRDISRGESVAFIYRYVNPQFTADDQAPFQDVPVTHTFFEPVSWAADEEITTGYADGEFKPTRDVTRGEFATFLYRAVDPDFEPTGDQVFRDVPTSSTHYEAIAWMASEGLSVGYADGNYRPGQSITRGEVAVLMHRYDNSIED